MAFGTSTPTVKVGQLVRYEGRIWRVGLVNYSRARLDPLSAETRTLNLPTGTKQVNKHGDPVNIGPTSLVEIVSHSVLSEHEAQQLARLLDSETRRKTRMTENVAAVVPTDTPAVADAPVAPVSNRQANKERLKKLAEKKAAAKGGNGKSAVAAQPKAKKEKTLSPCKCGCGEQVTGHFAQGHDARFKGWLLKVERGEMKVEELNGVVRKSYQWAKVKRSGVDGFIPTTNYKGEKWQGFLLADGSPRK